MRMDGWQPISTIPQTGEEVVVSYGHQGHVKKLVNFDKLRGYFVSKGQPELGLMANATHWLYLGSPEGKSDE